MNDSSPQKKPFNPWPYALIGFFVFFIASIVLFIIFALGQDMHLVRPDYYEEEIRYQQQIDREQRTQWVIDEVAISYDRDKGVVGIQLPVEHARKNLKGTIHFYRPSNADLDREVALGPGLDGRQNVDVGSLAAGLWNLRVFWNVDGEEYFAKQSVVIARQL